MIFDSLKNAGRYACLSENFRRAFEYLTTTDLSTLPAGRYEIDGDNVYLMIQEPTLKPWEEGSWEAHRNYADIQLVLEGCECIGFVCVEDAPVMTPYVPEKDILFYQEMPGSAATVHAGEMMVLFPSDAHRPCIRVDGGPDAVRKAVVKVRLN